MVTLIVGVVVMLVSSPLRQAGRARPQPPAQLRDLEAARDAKYREIRDAELDHRTGKLSDEDYAAVEAQLRMEAVEILRSIDTITGR